MHVEVFRVNSQTLNHQVQYLQSQLTHGRIVFLVNCTVNMYSKYIHVNAEKYPYKHREPYACHERYLEDGYRDYDFQELKAQKPWQSLNRSNLVQNKKVHYPKKRNTETTNQI